MIRSKAKRDKGYSLVEMIIVLAIIAVISGMSLLSITMIHSAKVKNAAITFNSEVSTLVTKSKNMSPEVKNEDGTSKEYNGFVLKVYKKADTNYYCCLGYYDSTKTGSERFVMDFSNETSLSHYAEIKFTGNWYHDDGSYEAVTSKVIGQTTLNADGSGTESGDVAYIRFDKRGFCLVGYGEYQFCKKRGGNQVARVVIRQNGSHFSR